MPRKCELCNKVCKQACSECGVVRYCSKKHQLEHWEVHKPKCFPIIEMENEELGKYIVTSKDLVAGQIIIREPAIITCPFSDVVCYPNKNICLTCCMETKRILKCYKCGWSMCSEECMNNPVHDPECKLKSQGDRKDFEFMKKPNDYEYIFVVRCHFLRENNPELWNRINAKANHVKDIKNKDVVISTLLHKNINKIFNMDGITFADATRLISIYRTNRIKMGSLHKCGLYDKASFLSHSCSPNTFTSYKKNEDIVVRAAIDIPKGRILCSSYTIPTKGHFQRKRIMARLHCFECKCQRCSDPTDLGTHLNSILCTKCEDGLVTPPVGRQEQWICTSCKAVVKRSHANLVLSQVQSALPYMHSKESCETFLKYSKRLVGKNHYARIIVRANQIESMWIADEFIPALKDNEPRIKLKLSRCRRMLKLYDTILPGYNEIKSDAMRCLLHTLAWRIQNMKGCETHKEARKRAIMEMKDIAHKLKETCMDDSLIIETRRAQMEAQMYEIMVESCLKECDGEAEDWDEEDEETQETTEEEAGEEQETEAE